MENKSTLIRKHKSYHIDDRIKGLMCKILFSLLRKPKMAHNCFAREKKNSFQHIICHENLVICLLNQKSDYIHFRDPFIIFNPLF